jgi:Domain of unknown function (DUF4166)/Saccharopine dehydrogenase NADP binding domain
MKVLILGGYGTFGGRLAQLLVDDPAASLIIAGRSYEKAAAFCAHLGTSNATPASFDRNGAIEAQMAELAPELIVDASGPFQLYDDPYRVVRVALTYRIDYLDLADSTGFVKGIAQFDANAKARGVFLLSGASSFPVLTAAVIRRLAGDIATLEAVAGGIAPSPYAGVGLNVIRAIASYAGKQITSMADGKPHYALAETRRYVIAPPGRLPLDQVHFSLVDVPDLEVLPSLWPSLKDVWMGAGPVPESLHRALNLLAQAVRLRLIRSLTPLASFMHCATNLLRWGEHRGGMFVSVEGLDRQGQRTERSWHMIAEGDDGPFIPSMAAEVIIRNCIAGRRPAAGARPATNDVELIDYEAMFAHRRIYTGTRIRLPASVPLYRCLLGDAFDGMPAPWRVMHELKSELKAEGVARVDRGTGALARLVANLFGFPAAGGHVPVKVTFTARDGIETWRRQFADRCFVSTQQEGSGRFERLLCERFGPFRFGLALVVDDSRMHLIVRRWSAFGIVLPRAWAPISTAYEFVEDGRFNFHVEIGHPLSGLIVRYQGWLVPRP